VLSEEEAELVRRAREAVAAAIAVDDFAPDAFRRSGEDAPDRDPADQPLRLVGGAGSGGLA
jgi:hypothetical protein